MPIRRTGRWRPFPLAAAVLALALTAALPAAADGPPATASPPTAAEAAYYTRPLVRARLRLPRSLSDYTVVRIEPLAAEPGRFEVEVRFRARTPFGAWTSHVERFRMRRAEGGGWIVTAP